MIAILINLIPTLILAQFVFSLVIEDVQ